jgi:hypothetical protein
MQRFDIINKFIEKYNYKSYLEIGTYMGETFNNCRIENKVGIDIDLAFNNPNLIKIDSDKYFAQLNDNIKYDIIFIDGLHEADQVFRDIYNSIKHLNLNGTIIVHDCNPPSKYHTRSAEDWNGSVYIGYIDAVNTYNLNYFTIDTDWGCGVIQITDSPNLNIDRKYMTTDWNYFYSNRQKLLNLISVEFFLDKYTK